jgi:hypothetical protein
MQVKKITVLFSFSFIILGSQSFSQQKDSTVLQKIIDVVPGLKISGYVDVYYAYYTDSVGTNNYQKFPVISPKSNAFGLNILQLTAQYSSEKVRATGTIHYGDIPASAWSPVFNMIQEANAGVRLTKKLWLDAGFFKTHIGTEALLPKDNVASSLSIITFYEPWWQSGIKLTYSPTAKLVMCLHVLNGYNTFVDNNKSKSFGITFSYTFNDKLNINYYNLIGEESPENISKKHLRFLNNVVLNYQITPKFKTIIGVDYITQQHSGISDTNKTASIYSAIVTLKYQVKPKFGIYGRGELYSDKEGVLTGVITDKVNRLTGYELWGATLGVEYKPTENSFIRLEGRELVMDKDQEIFYWNKKYINNRMEVQLNVGVFF